MKPLDRFIQNWRMKKARAHVPPAARVIDVGAHEGEFFRFLGDRLREGFGVEPLARNPSKTANYQIRPGYFPAVMPDAPHGNGGEDWDVVSILAVLEHIPRGDQAVLADACHRLLKKRGRVIITVPSPTVDRILDALRFLRLIDGMSLEEHYGFKPADTEKIFAHPRFRLVKRARFQLGLNHLFVFEKN